MARWWCSSSSKLALALELQSKSLSRTFVTTTRSRSWSIGRKAVFFTTASLTGGVAIQELTTADTEWTPVRAIVRSTRTVIACSLAMMDYYQLPDRPQDYGTKNTEKQEDEIVRWEAMLRSTHRKSAARMLSAFQKNGGVYVKLGQHIASLSHLVPFEYVDAMRVLQDKCLPSSMESIAKLYYTETGKQIDDSFVEFDEKPIGGTYIHVLTKKIKQTVLLE
jgi:hypothetical protein